VRSCIRVTARSTRRAGSAAWRCAPPRGRRHSRERDDDDRGGRRRRRRRRGGRAYPALLPELPVQPTRGQVLATAPLRERCTSGRTTRGRLRLLAAASRRRLVLGGNATRRWETEETDVEETTRLYRDGSMRFLEQLVGYRPEVTTAGRVWGTTPDRVPLVGEVRDGVWVAGGYSGQRQRAGARVRRPRRARDRRRAAAGARDLRAVAAHGCLTA